MNKEYQEVYDQLKAPEEWKNSIKAQMKEAVLQEQNEKVVSINTTKQKKKKSKKGIYALVGLTAGSGTIVAAAAVLGIVVLANLSSSSIYKTPMKNGVYYNEVALKQGNMYFNQEEEDMFLNLGLAFGQMGTDVPVSTDENVKVAHGSVKISSIDGGKMPAKGGEMSLVEDTEVYITSRDAEGDKVFTAIYEKDGKLFTVESEHLSQKEFIEYLYKMLTK